MHRLTTCLALALGIAAVSPAVAAECANITPYQAYQRAAAQGWGFRCHNTISAFNSEIRFVAEPDGALACTGHVVDRRGQQSYYEAIFFVPPGKPASALRGGWSVKSLGVAGGSFLGRRPDLGGAASFSFRLQGVARLFNVRLQQIVFEKKGGDCARVLDEAFVR